MNGKTMRKINTIIIHHSATEFGSADQMSGFHFVILNGTENDGGDYLEARDGVTVIGNSLESPGKHTIGHDLDSVGICIIGNQTFSEKQFSSFEVLVRQLKTEIPNMIQIVGHDCYEPVDCPAFDWREYLGSRGL